MISVYLLLFISFISPLPLLTIEKILPFPSIIEELFGLIIVLLFLKYEKKLKKNLFWFVLLAGLLFSLSESIIYLNNIFQIGNNNLFVIRLAFTALIHTANLLFIYLLGKKGVYWLIIALIIAIAIHFIYNNYLVYYIVAKLNL